MPNQVRVSVSAPGAKGASSDVDKLRDKFEKMRHEGAKGLGLGVGVAVGTTALNAVGNAAFAVGHGLEDVVAKGAAFERGMLNINSIAKVSRPELDAMGKSVLGMSGEFGQSADTMTAALYDINSSGFAGAKGIDVLRASSKAATAGLATTSEAAKGITAVLNSYGLQAADSAHVSDVLFKTVERGVVSFPELSAVIGTTAALASPLGVSLEEVGAALSVMTRHGIDAENATTQLNAIMSSMLQPSVEAAALAKQLGIDWSSAGLKANGLTGQLQSMIDKTGGSSEKMAVLLGDTRAIRGAFSLASGAGKELNDELGIMQNAAGATDSAFGIQSQGAAFKMAQATEKLNAALIELGEKALPLVASGADGLSHALDGLGGGFDALDKSFVFYADHLGGWNAPEDEFGKFQGMLSEQHSAIDDLAAANKTYGDVAVAQAQRYSGATTVASQSVVDSTADMKDAVIGYAATAASAFAKATHAAHGHADTLLADAQKLVDDYYDVIITQDQLVATNAEITAQRRILASSKSTKAEKADAKSRLHELEKTQKDLETDLASHGATTSKAFKDTMADLLKRLKGAHGDERTAILNEIKALNLLAFQASVTSGQIHDVIGLIGGAIGKTFGGGFGHKATGGPVRKGEPVIVGEDRPELFVPDENGTILPRVSSGGGTPMGSGSVTFAPTVVIQGIATPAVNQAIITQLGPLFAQWLRSQGWKPA